MSCPESMQTQSANWATDSHRRAGFSMFEVMVAMAVCVSGIVLIIGMMQTAENFTKRAQTRMTQQLLCQNLMNQVLLGIIEPRELRRTECPENEDFWYSMRVERYPHLPMQRIEVAVWPKSRAEQTNGSRIDRAAEPTSANESTATDSDGEAKKFILISLLPIDSPSDFETPSGQFPQPVADSTREDHRTNPSFLPSQNDTSRTESMQPW